MTQTRQVRTPAGNVETIDVTEVGRRLESIAVERDRIVLREQVRRMLVYGDEARQLKGRVLQLLDTGIPKVTTDRESPSSPASSASAPLPGLSQPTAAGSRFWRGLPDEVGEA